jgi:4'-phosphopantetheinyl transferase EntD
MSRLLPSVVATAETREELTEADLFRAERHSLGRATEGRRREFITGRACARLALAKIGVAASAIPVGERGQPLWPSGVAGSITHCRGYRACAVAKSEDVIALGIDVHLNEPLPPGLLARIAVGGERRYASGPEQVAPGRRPPHRDKLLFCAKEAVYKTYFAVANGPLGFGDIEVSMAGAQSGPVRARLRGPRAFIDGAQLSELWGCWGVEEDLVGVAMLLGRRARERSLSGI